MRNPLAGLYTLTQSWAQHIATAGRTLGGEDYATPYGTRLPDVPGVVEYVTPRTKAAPAWYNSGLGNAVAYRRPDGTRTVYAHLSGIDGRIAISGNSGTVRPAPSKSNPYAGSHVHVHDVAADGVTRLPPFTTATASGGAGGHTPEETPDMPRYIYTDEHGEGFALIDSNYTDGVIVAPRGPVADAMSYVTPGGAPEKLTRKLFNASCAAAATLWRAHAHKGAHVDLDELDVQYLADTLLAKLAPTLVTDADLDALRDEVVAAIPTTFTATPKGTPA